MTRNIKLLVGWMIMATCLSSCKKFVQVSAPVTGANGANVYASDATAIAAVTGVYVQFSQGTFNLPTMLALLPAVGADELTYFPAATIQQYAEYYQNELNANTAGYEFWNIFYPSIFTANSALEGLASTTSLTPAVKTQLLGEAYFIRAFSYFYLTNLYGDVPLVTGTNYTVNAILPRTPQAEVWDTIVSDLKNAQNMLSRNNLDGTLLNMSSDRLRPTWGAATAMLARAYLYTGDYADAQTQASAVIADNGTYGLSSLGNAFLMASMGNQEAIWQIQPIYAGVNAEEARFFVMTSLGPSSTYPVWISPQLLSAFEPGDQRMTNWVGNITVAGVTYYFPYKFKVSVQPSPVSEYEMVLRLGEQYLIRAEAEANLNDSTDAVKDLNVIRSRAGLPGYGGPTDKASLVKAVLHERQVELFTEWGNRWLDLKRRGAIDSVMSVVTPLKGGTTWSSNWALYPLPLTDIKTDPFLVQNLGY